MTYQIRKLDCSENELVKVVSLLQSVFPNAGFTRKLLKWQYVQNPDGVALGYNAWHDSGTLAAHYATMPIRANINGLEERGLLSLNTATDKGHAGKGLFTRLAQETYAKAREEGFKFVIGVANAASTPGFVRKLNFQEVGPLRAMIGLGNVPRSEAVDNKFGRVWNAESILWRSSHPDKKYARHHHGDRTVISTATGVLGITAIMGEFSETQIPGVSVRALPLCFQLHIGLDPSKQWGRSLYVNIPMLWRPSPLNLIFLDLTGQGRILDVGAVVFRAMDFDAY